MISRVLIHLSGFGFSNIPGKYAAYPLALGMHGQHYLSCLLTPHTEKALKNFNHELHWSVIVVQQYHLVHRRRFEGGLGLLYCESAIVVLPIALVVTHA